ncbi:hypothetical protein O7627_24220 [Solwaraspora sp. WMMD1047]|nr:hypothetical protein [Solwaraspora sp. WMMD1047]MDG4832389.1 hypothetical protein [Solwaraspora sp. WMMD1047]
MKRHPETCWPDLACPGCRRRHRVNLACLAAAPLLLAAGLIGRAVIG